VSTHKTPDILAWLAKHPRFTFHFTPTSASWMNQVETWFGILSRRAIRRGSFESVRALSAAIERFTREWNAGASRFTWAKNRRRDPRQGCAQLVSRVCPTLASSGRRQR
jgi:hypothetical protein